MSFHDSTRFIFEFLLKLAHMSLLKVFMQYLRFLDFYMSNDPKLELDLRKLAEFRLVRFLVARTVRGYGADSPPFIRIVHQRLCREVVNRRNSLRTVRKRTADGPRMLGRGSSVSCSVKNFKGGRSAKGPRTVRDWTELWGRPDLTYIGCPPHLPHQTEYILQKCLSLSLSSTWGRRQGQALLEWFPDGPSTSPDSSQDSASCPLGISMNP